MSNDFSRRTPSAGPQSHLSVGVGERQIVNQRRLMHDQDREVVRLVLREWMESVSPIAIANWFTLGSRPIKPDYMIAECCEMENIAIRAKNGICVKRIAGLHTFFYFCETHWPQFLDSDPLFSQIPRMKVDERSDTHMKYVQEVKQSNRTGRGNFLKPPMVEEILKVEKSKSVVVTIDDRAPNRDAIDAKDTGPFKGKFGIDVPISRKTGQRYILTIPEWTEDFSVLLEKYSTDFNSWVGKSLRLSIGQSDSGTQITRIQPV